MSLPHVCVPVSPVYVPFGWLGALEFPENPDGTHLVATHCIVTPFLGMVHAVLSQLPLPFYTSLFSLTKNFPLLLNTLFLCDAALYLNILSNNGVVL